MRSARTSLLGQGQETEKRSTAAADALTALVKTDTDTTEAGQHFNEEMDALLNLRQQLAETLLAISA